MRTGIDILENEIVQKYPDVLNILIRDHTIQKNIFWATDNYEHLGDGYAYSSPITSDLVTGNNGDIIMPRVYKDKVLQKARSKEMAEVFTPSLVCNAQNNLIDDAWFGQKEVFNREITNSVGTISWETNHDKIKYPKGKTWKHYIRDTRLEIACGEAPYITSRYDTTTGEFIPIEERIGILNRKLRVINENVESSGDWLKAAQIAYKNTYAYEWQGDSLLLAREAMLVTFIENYQFKFGKEPLLKSIQYIAYIISWNVWQMDGLKGVIPNTCGDKTEISVNLFGESESKTKPCEGCEKWDIKKHNGIYCLVKDWANKDLKTGKTGRKIRFVDLLNDQRISVLVDYETSKSLFPTVDIAGGLCYFLWAAQHQELCNVINSEALISKSMERRLNEFDVFVRSNAAISILKKVTQFESSYLRELVLSINPFGFRTYFRGRGDERQNDIRILTSAGWSYVSREEVSKSEDLIDKYKIIVGRFVPSNGELNVKPGEGYRVITNPQILKPDEINTETYIDVAALDTEEEALNYTSYLHTKFTRFLLRQSITSVNVTKECFSFTPLQDFTSNSDINWRQSIPEIDQQLYRKYKLNNKEIAFVERMIKPMG